MPVGTFHLLLGVLFFAVWFMAGVVRIRQRDAQGAPPTRNDRWHHPSPW
jgi:hypothetical protein